LFRESRVSPLRTRRCSRPGPPFRFLRVQSRLMRPRRLSFSVSQAKSELERMNIGVLASREGTTLQSILDACRDGRIAARVAVVISNNSNAGALNRARQARVPAIHLSSKTHPEPASLDAAILDALLGASVDLVFLAGYMKGWPRDTRRVRRADRQHTSGAVTAVWWARDVWGSGVPGGARIGGGRVRGVGTFG
jgi:hypothetical protein